MPLASQSIHVISSSRPFLIHLIRFAASRPLTSDSKQASLHAKRPTVMDPRRPQSRRPNSPPLSPASAAAQLRDLRQRLQNAQQNQSNGSLPPAAAVHSGQPPPSQALALVSTNDADPTSTPPQRSDMALIRTGPESSSPTSDETVKPHNGPKAGIIFCICGSIDPPAQSEANIPSGIPHLIECTTCPRTQHTVCVIAPSALPSLPSLTPTYRCHICAPALHTTALSDQRARLRAHYTTILRAACTSHLWCLYCTLPFAHRSRNPDFGIPEVRILPDIAASVPPPKAFRAS